MKKLMKSLMLFAAAAMALTSCENEAMNEGIEANDTYTMTFVAGAPESKTSVAIDGDDAIFSWSADDKIGFYKVANGIETSVSKAVQKKNCSKTTIAGDGTATFTVSFDAAEGATSYNIGAFYPGNSWVSHASENPFNDVKVKIAAEQKLTENTFDPAADLMMSKPFMGIAIDSEDIQTLQFTRLAAIGRMNLKGVTAGETIQSVTIEFTDNTMNGSVSLDLENSEVVWGTEDTSNKVVLTGELTAATETPIFFTCFPGDYSGAYSVTVVTQTTDNQTATYTKTGTIASEKALAFTSGDIMGFNLTVGNKECVQNLPEIDVNKRYIFKQATEFVGGKWYAIVANNVAATAVSGNYGYLQAEEPIAVESNISLPASCAFGFLTTDGGYTIQQYDGKYLYMTGTYSSFNVIETPTENYVYTVAVDNGTATIVNVGKTATVQYSTDHNSFGAYTTASYTNPTLYEMVEVDNGSYLLKVDPDNLSFIGAGGESTFTVSTYGEGELTVTADQDWLTATVENNTVTVTASKNDNNTTREGNITVSFAGMNKTVTISQAVVVSGEVIDVLTANLFVATSTTYKDFSGVTVTSSAVYAGNNSMATDKNNAIQLRSSNNNSGIVTTTSGGKAQKVVVAWNSNTSGSRVLDVYGKNTAYTQATDLYSSDAATKGTLLGSIAMGSTELTISGDYEYIGLRSRSSAMYIESIQITWAGGNTPVDPGMETLATPTNVEAVAVEKVVLISWDEVANATSYYVTCGTQEATVTDLNNLTAEFTMDAYGTKYDITVVAKAEGYNDSAAAETTVTTETDPNATETTFTLDGTFTFANSELSLTQNGITVTQYKVSGTTAVSNSYNTASTLRVYKGHALSFTGKTITRIEITYDGTRTGNTITVNTGTFTASSLSGGTHVWTGESDNVVITNTATATNVQLRPTQINITYKN